jgi:hypothetical protein
MRVLVVENDPGIGGLVVDKLTLSRRCLYNYEVI